MSYPVGLFVPRAAIKAAVLASLSSATCIVDPVHAERPRGGPSTSMTRALIADPDLPRKARDGRIEDIRVCVGANEGCIDRIYQGKPVTCIQNPGVSREGELSEPTPATTRQRVVVVGAGVAGLEAARVAALRGHHVVLLEREAEVGGQVLVASRAPQRAEYGGIVRFLARQVGKLPIDCRLDVDATASIVMAESPDVVIVATGSSAAAAGLDGKHVVVDVLLDRSLGERACRRRRHTQQGLSAGVPAQSGCQVEVISRLYPGQISGHLVQRSTRLFAKTV
jgi:hypothetical protein